MANLLRTSGRVVDTTLTASVGVVTNLAEVLNTGAGIISAQLSSIAEDVARSKTAAESDTVKKHRDEAARIEAENDALRALIAAKRERAKLLDEAQAAGVEL